MTDLGHLNRKLGVISAVLSLTTMFQRRIEEFKNIYIAFNELVTLVGEVGNVRNDPGSAWINSRYFIFSTSVGSLKI